MYETPADVTKILSGDAINRNEVAAETDGDMDLSPVRNTVATGRDASFIRTKLFYQRWSRPNNSDICSSFANTFCNSIFQFVSWCHSMLIRSSILQSGCDLAFSKTFDISNVFERYYCCYLQWVRFCFQFRLLPVKVMERIIMKSISSFWALRSSDTIAVNSDLAAVRRLASVCCDWWQTIAGWRGSTTSTWLRHNLRRFVGQYVDGWVMRVEHPMWDG